MVKRRITKLIHEGDYVAKVGVELIYTDLTATSTVEADLHIQVDP